MEDIIYGTIGAAIKGYCVRKNIDPLSIVKINKGRHAIITPQGGNKTYFLFKRAPFNKFSEKFPSKNFKVPDAERWASYVQGDSINEDLFRDAIYMHGCEKIAIVYSASGHIYEANSKELYAFSMGTGLRRIQDGEDKEKTLSFPLAELKRLEE